MTERFHDMSPARTAQVVGGKAAVLMDLVEMGFDVPAFLVVTPDAFADRKLADEQAAALIGKLPQLGPGPYAVRSSAREEDGKSHSHAGQFLSVLEVIAGDVPQAAARVLASGLADNVAGYRAAQGLASDGGLPAVLVQQMVDARCAGVAFTADPVSGRTDRIVVSAIEGLGDRLVGGEEDGQTYDMDKATGAVAAMPEDAVLTRNDLQALSDLSQKLETALGGPQDFEWAFEGERLLLLQARPITTRLRVPPVNDDTLLVFDNSNIVESYPGLVSPLTYSFAQYAYARVYRAFVRLVGVREDVVRENAAVFDNMLSRIDGRVYYNLGNWYRALALLPGFSANRGYMETMMGVNEPLPAEFVAAMAPPPAGALARLSEGLRVAAVGLRLGWAALRLNATIKDFYRRLNDALSEPAASYDSLPASALVARYRRIEADLLDRWDAPLVNDFLCMIAFGASRKLLERWAGPAGLDLHNEIMIGQGDMISAEPARRIQSMGRLAAADAELRVALADGRGDRLETMPVLGEAVDDYLAKFSERCTEELKLESVTLDRDPSPLYRAIAAAAEAPAEKSGPSAQHVTLAQLFAGRPVRRAVAGLALGWAKRRVRDRENLRFERTRIFGRARHLLRAAGRQFYAEGLIEAEDDVFFLTIAEVLGAIEGFAVDQDLAAIVRLRKQEAAAAEARPDPGERLLVRGGAVAGLRSLVPAGPREHDTARERRGTGCSAGRITAVARVVRDPRAEGLQRGEILVARHTDPGWIAIFSNAAAIVVERGSLLSHSAIVARELGIPCVVGLKGAMDWIEDGETIEVDGATGQVRKLP
ncbi:PEP/pyruvate-binding domain-containing protein [Devosia nitrariae]|uniref:Phosphoenolpyruvate synthase n=1 Tax=Devosia nitrariae TaxID=2071872 RepID=A0ABQ5VZE7_9HYPH|nr:PEP/pyruvate-binding domain-containing protein [Devosia nitrariae]GLQ52876.1 phosphoenolpyruvate synthase [Devosia nitrariae]